MTDPSSGRSEGDDSLTNTRWWFEARGRQIAAAALCLVVFTALTILDFSHTPTSDQSSRVRWVIPALALFSLWSLVRQVRARHEPVKPRRR